MRKFNPEKELNKIKNGNRKKVLISICALLVMGVLGYSFALYQVRHSNKLVYTVVKPFSDKDITLAVYLGDEPSNKFPEKNSGYKYDHINCDNNSTATFDNIKWEINLKAKGKDKCDVYFSTTYKDESGANAPELYQGLIPVTIADDGTIKVANTDTDWYNYGDKRWANAVLVTSQKYQELTTDGKLNEDAIGKPLTLTTDGTSDILQMYVWIPRYKYQLFNVDNGEIEEQEIKIEFEKNTENSGDIECKYINNNNGTITENCTEKGTEIAVTNNKWYTHPAFTFGDTELLGIWVGKFETSGNDTNLKVIPNVTPLLNANVSYMFNASRKMEEIYASNYNINKNEIDTHMMKNSEWGVMTYLMQSKYGICIENENCTEVTLNSKMYTTGYDNANNLWYTKQGRLASTTSNQYGIFDAAGGAWEYVMGNMVNASGNFYASSSGLASSPAEKYYDKYEYDANSSTTHQRGHLGDATRETLKTLGNTTGSWYGDYSWLPYNSTSWIKRGGGDEHTTVDGLFSYFANPGEGRSYNSFRIVLTAQDGNE